MAELKSQRIKSLSTRYLGFYKNSVLVLLVGVVCFIVYANIQLSIESGSLKINNWFTTGYFLFFVYLWIRMNRNVHRVEFDEEFLFVILKGQDILIPLENIKDVDIKTLGGVYEVELYQAEQLGKKFYFKPSLLYPFNYKKKDDQVNILRRNIDRAQQRKQHFQANALHS
jgi:signal transduction histidine kinase